ncbi:MAG: YqgE/AlgH family protein [Alphaproteobacteria bacterium]
MRPLSSIAAVAAIISSLGLTASPAMAAAEPAAPPPEAGSLQGKFLVANPSLPDPRFAHAVILMVKHDATGAFGLVVNRPVGIAEVTPDTAEGKGGDGGPLVKREPLRLPAFLGGPVEPDKGFIIHTPEYKADDTVAVTARVAVTASAQILADMASGKGPKRTLYVVGYSGWKAGQLEEEMRRNSWFEAPVDAGLIFGGEDTDAVWEQAMEMRLRGI